MLHMYILQVFQKYVTRVLVKMFRLPAARTSNGFRCCQIARPKLASSGSGQIKADSFSFSCEYKIQCAITVLCCARQTKEALVGNCEPATVVNFSDNCNVLSYICILTQTYGMSSLLLQLRLAKSSKTLFFNNYFLEIRELLETFFSRISFFLRIKSKNLITLFITVLFFYPAIKYFGSCDPNQIITVSTIYCCKMLNAPLKFFISVTDLKIAGLVA